MTLKRYVIIRPNGRIMCRYNSNQELLFRTKEEAEKVAITWGTVKEVQLELN